MPIEFRLRPIPELLLDDQMRFWGYVKRLGPSDCWEWLACKVDGYGMFSKGNGNSYLASRVSYYLTFGEPGQLLVCHECNNPGCVNPKHLYLGTGSDNQKQSVLDGRHASAKRPNNAIFTDDEIRKIRRVSDEGVPQVEISKLYGCSRHTINHIVSYKSYQDVR